MENCRLLGLPSEMLTEVLSKLPFEAISRLRLVNKQFEEICKNLLVKGFKDSERKLKSLNLVKEAGDIYRENFTLENGRTFGEQFLFVYTRQIVDMHLECLSKLFSSYKKRGRCIVPGEIIDIFRSIIRLHEKSLKSRHSKTTELDKELLNFVNMSSETISHFRNTERQGDSSPKIETVRTDMEMPLTEINLFQLIMHTVEALDKYGYQINKDCKVMEYLLDMVDDVKRFCEGGIEQMDAEDGADDGELVENVCRTIRTVLDGIDQVSTQEESEKEVRNKKRPVASGSKSPVAENSNQAKIVDVGHKQIKVKKRSIFRSDGIVNVEESVVPKRTRKLSLKVDIVERH